MKRRVALVVLFAALVPALASGAERTKQDDAAVAALNSPERLVTIGNHARASSDFLLALSFYERALKVDPNFTPALRAATEVALAVRVPQALAYAERWVSRQPRDGLAHLAVGAALVEQNRPSEAQKAIALAEAAGGPAAAIAVQRGLAFDLLGRSRDAQIAFASALQRAPGDRSILEYMALSFAIGGDDAAALQLLQPEAAKASGEPAFERTLVLIHALAGRLDLARRIAATTLPPDVATATADLLRRVAALPTASEKAAAVHLGILPDAGRVAQAPPPVAAPAPARMSPAPPTASAPPPQSVTPPSERVAEAKPPPLKPVAVKPPPKPDPLPAALPKLTGKALKAEHVWLQLASSPDRGLLADDHAKLKKKSRGALAGYNAYVESADGTNRLLVGPFRSSSDVSKVVKRLKASGVSALPKHTSAGSNIAPL